MIETEFHSQRSPAVRVDAQPAALCPFHDGPETLDAFLAELAGSESREGENLLDAALDLRCLLVRENGNAHAELFLRTLLDLRHRLDGRHYLAFYRVRRWVQRTMLAEVRRHRGEAWTEISLPLDAGNFEQAVNTCLATLAEENGVWPALAQIRFRFTAAPGDSLDAAPCPLTETT
jgi:hypothetical protein